MSSSAGSESVRALLESERPYYIEVIDGPWEGHRFDVDLAGTDADTVALTQDSIRNTRGPIPNLSGARITLHRHLTLDEVFPKDHFSGSNDAGTADRLLCRAAGTWQVIYLLDNGEIQQWTVQGDGTFGDQGNRIIAPGEGFFVHPRATAITLTRQGMVRAHDFVCPLAQGVNFVAGGWPLNQSPANRNMGIADNFFVGSTNLAISDQFHVWRGDADSGQQGYLGYFLLDGGAPFQYWAALADSSLLNQSNSTLFKGSRATLIKVTSDRPNYRMSLPWTP